MRRPARGMTLLEAMTACAIVGILAALAVNSFQAGITNARNSDVVMSLFAQVLQARKVARTSNQPVRLAYLTTLDGGTPTARWERLPCDNETYGVGCPAAACATTTTCGTGGCPCREVGTWVSVPAGVDLTSWAGLCFQAGSGQAVQRKSSTGDCLGPVATGALGLRVAQKSQPDRWLVLEPVSGQPRLANCNPAADGGC